MLDLPYNDYADFKNDQPASHYEWTAELNFRAPNADTITAGFYDMERTPDGWCSKQKAFWMMNFIYLKKPMVIVEIGVWGGKSLLPMARAVKDQNNGGQVYGIDPWSVDASIVGMDQINKDWWSNQADQKVHDKVYNELQVRIQQFDLQDTVQLVRATSQSAPAIENIDILHIDGNHCEESAFFDVTTWVPRVVSGGMIFLDDLTWTINGRPTVQKSVQWLDEHCIRLTDVPDVDNAWGVWIKK